MKPTDAAWLAGLFDGDGNLNYERRAYRDQHRSQTSPGAWRVRARIGTSDKPTVDHIVGLVGGTYHAAPAPSSGRMHYQWECSAKLAREMLTAIQPYVVTKKQRVDLALEAEALRMAASRRVGITGTGSAIGEEVHTRLVEISAAIRALNMKGPKALPKGPDGLSLKVSRTLHKLAR